MRNSDPEDLAEVERDGDPGEFNLPGRVVVVELGQDLPLAVVVRQHIDPPQLGIDDPVLPDSCASSSTTGPGSRTGHSHHTWTSLTE